MAYITLDDGSGGIELLAFQGALDKSGIYMQVENPVLVYGKISVRDDKEPQIIVDSLRPISDALKPGNGDKVSYNEKSASQNGQKAYNNGQNTNGANGSTIYVKLQSEDSQEYEKLKQIHMMFPGNERMVIHFNDSKKNVGAKCIIHEAFVKELSVMLGEENVVVR